MKRSLSSFDKIEDFLANRLSAKDKAAFEKEMVLHPDLELEVEKHKVLRDVLQNKKSLHFKRQLQSIQQEFYTEEKNNTKQKLYRYLRVVAIAIIVLGLGGILWNTYIAQNKLQDLYITYYSQYQISGNYRSEVEDTWKVVIQHYTKKEYTKAILTFEAKNLTSIPDEIKLCLGNGYLYIEKEEEARRMFANIDPESGFYEDALWYLALTHIKMKKDKEAIVVLEKIIKYNGKYKNKAITLKNSL
ncbi:hypothetical protein ATO12_08570 [Aquimarina atlantica]|uniref:Tetratricopeptide repeat protein n=1 Tax=Aquimarina atlantica TaxID=1317122 RepID=A0A023BXV6_9FLAO|nr:hypothetical protein [Aquimarina atlantica]EZH74784.1 hypothetical protein ATO12_08570 [Aquimarina atlantica]